MTDLLLNPVPQNHLIAKASWKANLRETPLLKLQPQPAVLPYLSDFQSPAGFAVHAALMRTSITTHRSPSPSPSPQQQRRAPRPNNERRTMTAPTSSFPSRPALTSRSESSQSQSATQDVEEAIEAWARKGRGPSAGSDSEWGAEDEKRAIFDTCCWDGFFRFCGRRAHGWRRGHGERHAAAESSGDEITPIVSRERGGGKGYDATAASNSNSKPRDNVRSSSQGSAGSGVRRRAEKKRRSSKGSRGSGPGPDDREGDEEEEGGWWARTLEKFGSVELDNKGSVARDHLALERTFLAWLRTSLAFASIGIAITQLFRLNTTISRREGLKPADPSDNYHLRQLGKPLGATFLGIAILVLAIGGRRYFESQYWIIRGKFPASRGSIFLITFVALTLIITSLVVVITVDPAVYEKR
ncbi:hypothetical protein G7Y79_00001g001860 [Physcia stellaris]|nr:hypothetical protein G7Y79_00001g001860 [Physcia stellaris]